MAKITRKVLILGNGFDLDLGRKTSYKDFYNSEYCPKDYPAPIIKHLNEKWVGNLDAVKWYDLENEILNYYEKIKTEGDDYDLYNACERKIIVQIKQIPTHTTSPIIQDNLTIIKRLLADNILSLSSNNYVCAHPDAFLSPVERDAKALRLIKTGLIQYVTQVQSGSIKEDSIAAAVARAFVYDKIASQYHTIYTFNYIKLTNNVDANWSKRFDSITKHIHGSVENDNIIIGTKDYKISQEYDFIQKSFDSNYNPPAMVSDLMSANDITVFGHSLGVNDSQYFKPFFKQQSSVGASRKNITIFTKDKESELQIKRSLQEMTGCELSALFSMNDLQIIKVDECRANSNMMFRDYIKRFCENEYEVDMIISGRNYKMTSGMMVSQIL
ncbi:MAG: hypothetical protein IKJ49_02670 [Bacteroidaceae bacterium]|nr:hypothetical protein [Bacteroidaceae bacterium]